jgi:predicted component of type VI protein secretion system
MSRTPLLLALLGLLVRAPAAFSGPPDGPSGQLVQDAVPALTAEVKRLEKEAARDKSLVEELDVARARLAAAQGRTKEARAAWRKVIDTREERLARVEALARKGLLCNPSELTLCRGHVSEARCGLAEVERDWATLARELPKAIACWEARLAAVRTLARAGAIPPDDAAQKEKALLKELRQRRSASAGGAGDG